MTVAKLPEAEIVALASEPVAGKRQREFWSSQLTKLEQGREMLGEVMSSVME